MHVIACSNLTTLLYSCMSVVAMQINNLFVSGLVVDLLLFFVIVEALHAPFCDVAAPKYVFASSCNYNDH